MGNISTYRLLVIGHGCILGVAVLFWNVDVNHRCLKQGWPHYRFAGLTFKNPQCVKTIDGTEVIRPLAEIEAGK